jgi:hypothetical protein
LREGIYSVTKLVMSTPIKIYTGTDNFKTLVLNSDVLVDKSFFIKEFIEGGAEVSLITRPRRWGKSLNMSMLKHFLKSELDEFGKPLPEDQQVNRKLFVGGKIDLGLHSGKVRNLKRLKIAEYDDIITDYQGQYPVISISFNEVKGDTYNEVEKKVSMELYMLFSKYKYLLNYISNEEKTIYNSFINGTSELPLLTYGIKFLSSLLYNYHGKKVFILIDEYDAAINEAYLMMGKESVDFAKVLGLFRGIYGTALKGNEYLEKGLLTGILRIAKAGLLSGVNNPKEYSLLDKKFATCYGFTEQEVDELLNTVPVQTSREKIKSWYNGYNFRGNVIYNPWSIMNCLANGGELDKYWLDSGGTSLVDSALVTDEIQEDLKKLLSGDSIITPIRKQVSFDDLSKPTGLYSLLLFAGYLNPNEVVDSEENIYKLNIPNYEVRHIYKQRLLDWVTNKLSIDSYKFYNIVTLLIEGRVEEFRERFQELLKNTTNFFQTGNHMAEMFYSSFILGMVSSFESLYHIDSERETGKGRADLLLIPKAETPKKQGIVIEYKVGKDIESLKQRAKEGLAQINAKGYDTKVKTHKNITSILKVCMSFYDNNVEIAYQVDSINTAKN